MSATKKKKRKPFECWVVLATDSFGSDYAYCYPNTYAEAKEATVGWDNRRRVVKLREVE